MENPWKTKSSKIVYETPWMKIREDEVLRPDGTHGQYSFVETPNSVFVIPMDEEQKVYLVSQWRYPTKTFSWEFPGGSSDGQDILQAAKRELKEETGFEAESWTEIGKLEPMNGIASETEYVFLAQKLRQTSENKEAAEGINNMKKVSFAEVNELIRKGEIIDAQSIAAFTQAKLWLNK